MTQTVGLMFGLVPAFRTVIRQPSSLRRRAAARWRASVVLSAGREDATLVSSELVVAASAAADGLLPGRQDTV